MTSQDGRSDREPAQVDQASVITLREMIVPLLPNLRAFARSLSKGDVHLADDLVQDAVMLALRHWGQFQPGTNLKAWLFKILHNRWRSVRRRKHIAAEVTRTDLEVLSWVPPGQESVIEVAAFRRAFQALSPAHRGPGAGGGAGAELRAGGRDLRLRDRHGEEPGQPGAGAAEAQAARRGRACRGGTRAPGAGARGGCHDDPAAAGGRQRGRPLMLLR
jgi:RNA polymerase sigma-70 factor (ECF subfamily)